MQSICVIERGYVGIKAISAAFVLHCIQTSASMTTCVLCQMQQHKRIWKSSKWLNTSAAAAAADVRSLFKLRQLIFPLIDSVFVVAISTCAQKHMCSFVCGKKKHICIMCDCKILEQVIKHFIFLFIELMHCIRTLFLAPRGNYSIQICTEQSKPIERANYNSLQKQKQKMQMWF